MENRQTYYESTNFPQDYLQFKRISVKAKNDCCKDPKNMVVYLGEQANVDQLLRDKNKQPSYEWGETFATMSGNAVQVYTNGTFNVAETILYYYRQPIRIEIAGVVDPYTGIASAVDVNSEFKDDLVEVFIDECAMIMAGDIESQLQMQRQAQSVEQNN
jgi:hypothetical protein